MPRVIAAELALDAGAALGECPVWDAIGEELVWVDCLDRKIHRLNPQTGTNVAVSVGQRVGSVAMRRRGGLVMAIGHGFSFLDEQTGIVKPAAGLQEPIPYVMNDGACDAAGRFWAGTASDDGQPTAGLYRLDPDGTVRRIVTGVRMSNGIGWSPDSRLMYYVDSRTQGLDVFEFHTDGTLGHRRRLVDIDVSFGIPDGLAVDVEGCIWLAMWGLGVVRRYTPSGALDREIAVPTSNTTSCAFGGPALDVLYITSAKVGLTEQQRQDQPHAGAVFAAIPGVVGLPQYGYAG